MLNDQLKIIKKRVRKHFRKNKKVYVASGAGFAIGFLVGSRMKSKPIQIINTISPTF